jgi:rhodanese-related sulfurtransferase
MKLISNPRRSIGSMSCTLFLVFGIVAASSHLGAAQSTPVSPTDAYSSDHRVIDVETFDVLRKNKEYVKLDVRASDAVATNSLGGSVELDFSSASFASELAKLDKDKHYLVFSEDGINSAKAVQMMTELGFMHVSNLEGGFTSWMAADRPPE